MEHQPVLAERVVELLEPAVAGGGAVVDCTVGGGGHAARILAAAPAATLVGIDRDPDALAAAGANLAAFHGRVRLARDNFESLAAVLERFGIAEVRGVLFDFGVSSPQLDRAERGFGWRHDGPLDMRMDPAQRLTAADVVNGYARADLERVIARYGEERFAARIARAVERARPLSTTAELAGVVTAAIPAATRRTGRHPARRTFQAIRIEVNDELGAIERALPAAADVLGPGGRLVAISYHSLEDRAVKTFFRDESRSCVCPPETPVCICSARARLRIVTRRPDGPSPSERARNPRSSAAKLRAAERLGDAGAAPAR